MIRRREIGSKTISAHRSGIKHLQNSIRIWRGLFYGTPSLLLQRFSWEVIQTVLGFISAHTANLLLNVREVKFTNDATVLEGGGWKGSLSLGNFILLYPGYHAGPGHFLYMHEYGHYLQSRESGLLYLFKYGIPSVLTDNYAWMEKDANLRAAKYFEKEGIPLSAWSGSSFKDMPATTTKPKWWEYILLFMGIGIILLPILNRNRAI